MRSEGGRGVFEGSLTTGKGRGHPENRGVEVAGLVVGLTELKLGDGRRKERELMEGSKTT